MQRLQKLRQQDNNKAIQTIWDLHHKQWYCMVNFLYFANVVINKLPQQPHTQYAMCLMNSDILLPDGIALQTYRRVAYKLWLIQSQINRLSNINGTDFTPYFLQESKKQQSFQIVCYGWSASIVQQAAEKFHDMDLDVAYVQDWYSSFDRQNFDALYVPTQTYIMLVARGTPLQEMWVLENLDYIKKYKMIVLTVGWYFDFLTNNEIRAPRRMRGRWEWLFRLIHNPKKNARKVWYTFGRIPYVFRHLLLKRLTDWLG